MSIKHTFVSAIPDGPDATQVRPSNWNEDHTIDGDVDFNGNRATGLDDPVDPQDAATRAFVESRSVPGDFVSLEAPVSGSGGSGFIAYPLDLDALGVVFTDTPIIGFQWFINDGSTYIVAAGQLLGYGNAGNWDKTNVNTTISYNGAGEGQSIPSATELRLLVLYDGGVGATTGHLKITVSW
jgi:hypothetical protein